MKSSDTLITYKVNFKNGRFYNEDHNRISFVEGKNYVITGIEEDFSNDDEMLEIPGARTSEVIKTSLEHKHGEENLIKMFPSGTSLRFHFGLGKTGKGILKKQYDFEGTFEEDGYLYKLKYAPFDVPESWRMENCICSITKCTNGDIGLSEPIKAISPASAFAMLIGTHFNRQRSTSIKIYDHFWVDITTNNAILNKTEKQHLTLGEVRIKVLKENIERINAILKARLADKAKIGEKGQTNILSL